MRGELPLRLASRLPGVNQVKPDLFSAHSLERGSVQVRGSSSETKVADFDVQFFVNENVLRLDVSVDDVGLVNELQGTQNTIQNLDSHGFGELELLRIVEDIEEVCTHIVHNNVN